MTNEERIEKLKCELSPRRFLHTMGVAETAKELAMRFGADCDKAYLAGLLHDCAKDIAIDQQKKLCKKYGIEIDRLAKSEPKLLHSYVGAHLAQDVYGCDDPEILDAVYYHTTGKEDMSLLLKVVFLADSIEPGRGEREELVKVREAARTDIDAAIIMTIDDTVRYILTKGRLLHLDTLRARNALIQARKE